MAIAIALLTGLLIGGGFYLLRRHAWPILNSLGLIVALLIGAGVVIIAGLFLLASGKGGDGAMNAMIFVVFLGMVLAACLVISALLGAIQSARLRLPLFPVMRTLFLDCAALAISLYLFSAIFYDAPIKSNSKAFMAKEVERRAKVKELKAKLPLEYHENAAMMLHIQRQQEEMMRRSGRPMTESKAEQLAPIVAEYLRLRDDTPATPQSFYQDLNELQRNQRISLGIGWLLGSLLLPFFLPRAADKKQDNSASGMS